MSAGGRATKLLRQPTNEPIDNNIAQALRSASRKRSPRSAREKQLSARNPSWTGFPYTLVLHLVLHTGCAKFWADLAGKGDDLRKQTPSGYKSTPQRAA
jgi:hypothetical protein